MRRLLVATATTLAAATMLLTPATSSAANNLPRPDGAVEMQGAPDGKTVLRIKAGNAPAGATALAIKFYSSAEKKWVPLDDCPKSYATSNGGCAIDLNNGFAVRDWMVNWKAADGTLSKAWIFKAGDLATMENGDDTLIEGTKEMVWVAGTEHSAARIYKALAPVMEKQAPGCLKDAGVSAAMAGIKQLAGKAMQSNNPYVVGAGAIGYVVTKQDSKTYDNRCKAIALAVSDFRDAIAHARSIGRPARVYLTSVYGKWNNVPDSCVIFTSSGGAGGDSSDGSWIVTRPPSVGGPTQGQCLHFWDPIVG